VHYGDPAQGNPDLLLGTAPSRQSSNRVLLGAVGVLVVLIVIGLFAFAGGGGTKKKTSTDSTSTDTPSVSAPAGVDPAAKAQADAIYAVIQQSQGLTSRATGAIGDVEGCKNIQQAIVTFDDIATKRQAQADAVGGLPADKLVNGTQLVSDLKQAWQYSATSEHELAQWAQDNATCTSKPGNNDNRHRADTDGQHAGTSKSTAADEWNTAAAKDGEPTIKHTDL
jgi:hypothetical protein